MKEYKGRFTGLASRAGLFFVIVLLWGLFLSADSGEGSGKKPESEAVPSLVITLPGDEACHTQGIAVTDDHLFVSCVKKKQKKAMLYQYGLPRGFPSNSSVFDPPEITDLTRDSMYHPSGLDYDGKCLWVAVAHYRQFMASSTVTCLDPKNMSVLESWEVADHIGAVAAMGSEIVAMNWDARHIYRYSKTGAFIGKDRSPSQNAYQDCKGASKNSVICSGKVKIGGKSQAVVDLLVLDPETESHWRVDKSVLLSHPEVPLGREGFATTPDLWAFLPEDFPAPRLMIFKPPPVWP